MVQSPLCIITCPYSLSSHKRQPQMQNKKKTAQECGDKFAGDKVKNITERKKKGSEKKKRSGTKRAQKDIT